MEALQDFSRFDSGYYFFQLYLKSVQERAFQQQLIHRIRKGENKAVKELYKMSYAYCASCVLNNHGTRADAEDFYQRSMIVLLEKLQDDNFEIKHNIKSFLYTVIRNQWFKELKKRHITTSLSDDEGKDIILIDENDIEEKKVKEAYYQQMYAALKNTSPECQKLIELTFFKGKKDKEIAPLMNYSVEFVRNKRRRCIGHIKKQLGLA